MYVFLETNTATLVIQNIQSNHIGLLKKLVPSLIQSILNFRYNAICFLKYNFHSN